MISTATRAQLPDCRERNKKGVYKGVMFVFREREKKGHTKWRGSMHTKIAHMYA
jgi:hypothetical protein